MPGGRRRHLARAATPRRAADSADRRYLTDDLINPRTEPYRRELPSEPRKSRPGPRPRTILYRGGSGLGWENKQGSALAARLENETYFYGWMIILVSSGFYGHVAAGGVELRGLQEYFGGMLW